MKNLKRISIAVTALFLVMSLVVIKTAPAQEPDDSTQANAMLTINSVFGIHDVIPGSLNFPPTDPGYTTEPAQELSFQCSNNTSTEWSIWLSAEELSSGEYTIPNSNFLWGVVSVINGLAQPNPSSGTMTDTSSPQRFYLSDSQEWITDNPVEFHLAFEIVVPSNQAQGNYSTTLVITMAEGP